MHIPCPEQVSIVGFADFAWTQHFTPPLTVVAQPAREMGTKTMEILLAKIRAGEGNEQDYRSVIRLQPGLRHSTARPFLVCTAAGRERVQSAGPGKSTDA